MVGHRHSHITFNGGLISKTHAVAMAQKMAVSVSCMIRGGGAGEGGYEIDSAHGAEGPTVVTLDDRFVKCMCRKVTETGTRGFSTTEKWSRKKSKAKGILTKAVHPRRATDIHLGASCARRNMAAISVLR